MTHSDIIYRTKLKEEDLPGLRVILESSGFFYKEEIDIALELADENLLKGEEKSGYSFLLAEKGGSLIAFASYGKIPGTKESFDLYWIAVHEDYRGDGIGLFLLRKVEEIIADLSGRYIWVETSSRSLYTPTRKFYLKSGYRVTAELPHFYAVNDHKIIFVKRI